MSTKNVLITGANTGIGRATAEALADRGYALWLAGRSEERTRPVIEALRARPGAARVEFLPLDLADLDSVRECGQRFDALGEPLHVFIANAGLATQRGETKQGFELAFGTNHLGHFLLTELLLPSLRRGAPSRVVIVASNAHYRALRIDWDAVRRPTRSYSGYREYAVSKLCNVLHARELARRVKGDRIDVYSLHPGVVASDIWRRIPWPLSAVVKLRMISNEEGAKTSLFCATAPEAAGKSGLFWDKCRERKPSRLARNDDLAREVWEKSEAWTRG